MNEIRLAMAVAYNQIRRQSAARALAIAVSMAALIAALAGCSLTGSGAASSHACADKVASELATNVAVAGTWNCLDQGLQTSLITAGLPTGDAVFVVPGTGPISAGKVQSHYVADQNGVVEYNMILHPSNKPAFVVVLVVWTNSVGKVTNLNIASPLF